MGRWRKEDSVQLLDERFLKMSVSEMKEWEGKENKNDDRTFAQRIAYNFCNEINITIKISNSKQPIEQRAEPSNILKIET